MKLNFKHSRNATAVIVAISLSACVRFDTRMQANGTFDYKNTTLVTPYEMGDFSNAEARDSYVIPALTEQQKLVGFATEDVDIRPPTQLRAVIDGILLEKTEQGATKIWFNAFNQNDDMQAKVWQLLESYLAKNNIEIVKKDKSLLQIETGVFTKEVTFGRYMSKNYISQASRYKLSLETQKEGHSVALIIDALSYEEHSDEKKLKFNLVGNSKSKIEIRFVNALLEYAYQLKEKEQLEKGDTSPLAIKLGFDDNHQSTWIAESEFSETWLKMPELITLLNFEIVQSDKNLGYFLVKYNKPSDDYWAENNIKPFELDEKEYFIQLGEVTSGITSIAWLDEDKKPLLDQKITEVYLSITEHVRGALIESEKQTNEF